MIFATSARHALVKLGPVFVFIIELFIALVQAPWDVDAHHDGVVFAAAVAANEGKMPHSGYFEQYGPLAPTLQGLFLNLTSASLYSLRVLTSLTVAVIGLMLFVYGSKTLGVMASFFVSLLWTLSSPRMHGAMLPWSSFYSTLFLIFAIVSIQKYSKKTLMRVNLGYFLASIFIISACLCRINALATLIAIIFATLISKNWDALKSICLGGFLASALFTILAFGLGFLNDFIHQCIVWAFGTYSTGGAEDVKGHIVNLLLYLAIPFFGGSVFILSKTLKYKYSFAIIAIFLLSTLYFQNISTDHQSYANPVYLFSYISQHSHYMFSYLGIFICIFLFAKYTFLFRSRNQDLVLAAIGASTLSQLFPNPDPLHLWWVAPVALFAFFNFSPLSLKTLGVKTLAPGTLKLAGILSLVMLILLISESRIQRFAFQSSILAGMQGVTQSDRDLDRTLLLIQSKVRKGETVFDCFDGIYAVSQEGYLPTTKDYVNWSPRLDYSLWNSESIFVCNSPINAREYLSNRNFDIVFEVHTSKGYNFFLSREN